MKVGVAVSKEELIINKIRENNNYITTKDIVNIGIDKKYIPKLLKEKFLIKVCHGIYKSPDVLEDNYYIFQLRYPKSIFSYDTALYLLNLVDSTSSKYNVTSIRGKAINGDYDVHFVTEDKFEVGLTVINSPFGNPIRVYNAERTICDLLRNNSDDFDFGYIKKIFISYFDSGKKDIELLIHYSRIFNVYEKVIFLMEVLISYGK